MSDLYFEIGRTVFVSLEVMGRVSGNIYESQLQSDAEQVFVPDRLVIDRGRR